MLVEATIITPTEGTHSSAPLQSTREQVLSVGIRPSAYLSFSGLFKDSHGGCGTLSLIGNFTDFLALAAHGLTSAPFPTIFPSSFVFSDTSPFSHCMDLRDYALAFNIIITTLLFIVIRPRPIFLYWSLVCIGFWHITLYSQPQAYPPDLKTALASSSQRYSLHMLSGASHFGSPCLHSQEHLSNGLYGTSPHSGRAFW